MAGNNGVISGDYGKVRLADGTLIAQTKLWLTDDHLIVLNYVSGAPHLAYYAPVLEYHPSPRPRQLPHRIITADGEILITLASCSCGSPLKSISFAVAQSLLPTPATP